MIPIQSSYQLPSVIFESLLINPAGEKYGIVRAICNHSFALSVGARSTKSIRFDEMEFSVKKYIKTKNRLIFNSEGFLIGVQPPPLKQ